YSSGMWIAAKPEEVSAARASSVYRAFSSTSAACGAISFSHRSRSTARSSLCSSGSLKASNDGFPKDMATPCYSPVTLPFPSRDQLQPSDHPAVRGVIQRPRRLTLAQDLRRPLRQHQRDLVTGEFGRVCGQAQLAGQRRLHFAAIELAVLGVGEQNLVETD